MSKMSKKIGFITGLFLIAVFLFSCEKMKIEEVVEKEDTSNDDFIENIHIVRNPVTNSSTIFKGDGTIILNTVDPLTESLGIINDVKTDKPAYIYKVYRGETYDEEEYSYTDENNIEHSYTSKYPSERTTFYDINGNEVGFTASSYGAYKVLGKYLTYYDYSKHYAESNNLRIFNSEDKSDKPAPHRMVDYFGGHLLFSADTYSKDDTPKEILVVDDDLNVIKKIDGYSFLLSCEYGDTKVAKVMKVVPKATTSEANDGSMQDNNYYYNFIDENYDLLFEESVQSDTTESNSPVVTLHTDNVEFEYDFNERKKVSENRLYIGSDVKYELERKEKEKYQNIVEEIRALDKKYTYVDTNIFGDKVLFVANYKNEDNPDDWREKSDIYDIEKKLIATFDFVNFVDEDNGILYVNYDTFYDFDLNILKKFDEKIGIEKVNFGDKTYYTDGCDMDYNRKEKYNLYNSNFEIVLKDICNIDTFSLKNMVVVLDLNGTKVYDYDLNVLKALPRRLEFRDWFGIDKMAFYDRDSKLEGIIDKELNIKVDNLKKVEDLKEKYFTFQNGFKYGLMDYSGKKLIEFSIFDTMREDSDREDYTISFLD